MLCIVRRNAALSTVFYCITAKRTKDAEKVISRKDAKKIIFRTLVASGECELSASLRLDQ
jgi:hypothetical protein